MNIIKYPSIVCFSDGETWEEFNDGIRLIKFNKIGRQMVIEEGHKIRHLKEEHYTSMSLEECLRYVDSFYKFHFESSD